MTEMCLFTALLVLSTAASSVFSMHVISVSEQGECKQYSVNSPSTHGLEEEIADAINRSNWRQVKELLEMSLNNVTLAYAQLKDIELAEYLPWLAAERGYVELINVLISNGLSIDQHFDKSKYTMLHLAAANGHKCLVSFLLDNGANLEERDSFGWTAVHHAAVTGRIDLLKLLYKRGADINKQNTSIGCTPLHYAAFYGRLSMVYYLITETNCDSLIQGYSGRTAAEVARREGYSSIVEILQKNDSFTVDYVHDYSE